VEAKHYVALRELQREQRELRDRIEAMETVIRDLSLQGSDLALDYVMRLRLS